MNVLQRIKSALSVRDHTADTVPIFTGRNRRVAYQLQQRRRYRMDFGQAELKRAIDMAEDVASPRRELLYTIYRDVCRDLHLKSQMRTANNKVIEAPWAIVRKGSTDIDKERTALLQKKWFEDLRRHCLDAEFWGHSLLQFDAMEPNTDAETRAAAPFVFRRVALVPRENVEPVRGLLLVWPGDLSGIPYRDGLLGDWLLEAGDAGGIGLLADCARYSLFKKFGLSDWSRSGEKWGDPMLIIRSSSDDKAENDKKADFAAGFGNNGWAILDDDDKVDILERQNDKGYAIFHDLCKYLDDENSKGVNGQTGSSDQKAFVGSAEVHERLLESYTKERLRSEMYYMNETLLPFLAAKGYDLDGYEYRPLEFLRELTVPGTEAPPAPAGRGPAEGGAKDKPGQEVPVPPKKSLRFSPVAEPLSLMYSDCGHDACGHTHLNEAPPSGAGGAFNMDVLVQKALRRLFEGKTRRGDVDADLVDATMKELWRGIREGWQRDIEKYAYASPEHLNYLQLRHNTAVTAIFKNHTHNLEVLRELFDADGEPRTWGQFRKAALKISTLYNKNWLRAEYQTARASANMARKWQEFAKRPDGKIVYMTIGDGRVRDAHRVLDGVTKPVLDPFWNVHFPPLGYRCRCSARWVPGDEPDVEPAELPPVPPVFRGNVGRTGEVFNGEHPYFDNADTLRPNRLKLPISPERLAENVRLYREYERGGGYKLELADNLGGGFVFRHLEADAADLADNLAAGKVLASEGNAVAVRRHVNTPGVSNPELEVNGEVTDLKTPSAPDGRDAVFNAAKSARKQIGPDGPLTSFVLSLNTAYTLRDISAGLYSMFRNRSIHKVTVIRDGHLVVVEREPHFTAGIIAERLSEVW